MWFDPPEWMARARCAGADTDAFFPDKGDNAAPARRVCNGDPPDTTNPVFEGPCPVRTECLDWALDNNERFGVWGGVGERERRRLKRIAS